MKISEMSADRSILHKKTVSSVYETEAFTSLLRDALHPGGVPLTRRVAEIARPEAGSRVLDIGCGVGGGCYLFSRSYGCRVVGVDLSERKIAFARGQSQEEELPGGVAFTVCDAERLPFRDGCFDLVVSECVFSVLPDQALAAGEICRVLKSKGRMVMTDVVFREEPPVGTQRKLSADGGIALIPCLSGAGSLAEYAAIFERAGLHRDRVEDHTVAFRTVAYQMALRFGDWSGFLCKLAGQISSRIGGPERVEVDSCSLDRYRRFLSRAKLGYALIGMTKH